ncbi:MAG: pyridine nucleotide-disulfide oxidoreductase [Deltaproteobacteria bacterium]|nr:pyridine nucleotide-disulfide oxidoreductase [Deltaproteobacteria bacterium]
MSTPRHSRVVVVGGGFAGLAAAQALRPPLDVTLVDPGEWFEFLPNVHELLSGVKGPAALRLDRRGVVERAGHRFRRERVERIDPDRRRVHLADETVLEYDALIVAAGAENATYGVPGVHQHALIFRDVEQCARIGERLRELASGGREARVVIVGGGLEGVEALGEALRRHRDNPDLHFALVEARERLLPEGEPAFDPAIRRLCAPHRVSIRTGARATAIVAGAVLIGGGGSLPADATISTGGPIPAPVLARSRLIPSGREWGEVDETLRHRVYPDVFIAGDAAGFPGGLAKQAYHALDMGSHAAANAERQLRGAPLEAFRPSPKPMLVSFGDLTTFLAAGKLMIAAPALAAAKEAVFQIVMAQLDGTTRLDALTRLAGRLLDAGQELLWPVLSSPRALLGQANLQILAHA